MGPGVSSPAIGIMLAFVAASLLILVAGLVLRRQGRLVGRPAGLAWGALTLLPLFGLGLFTFTSHQVERAEGDLPTGYNDQFPQRDPANVRP